MVTFLKNKLIVFFIGLKEQSYLFLENALYLTFKAHPNVLENFLGGSACLQRLDSKDLRVIFQYHK